MSTAGRVGGASALKPNASLRELQHAFRDADVPELTAIVGVHDGEILGPAWLRNGAVLTMRLCGMRGWCGKVFRSATANGDTLDGENLVRRDGRSEPSIPMRARMGSSRVDGRPAIVLSYAADAQFPWSRVTDELRPLDDQTLLGLSFGVPLGPRHGTPFLLRRVKGTG